MPKLKLLVTTYYLQISWHDMNFKLTLGILNKSEVDQWFLLTSSSEVLKLEVEHQKVLPGKVVGPHSWDHL